MSATPTQYSRQFDFETFSQNNPNTQQPGVQLDAELNAVKSAMDSTQLRLAEVQRDDGALRNQLVSIDSLSPAVVALIQANGGEVKGLWVTATAYNKNDLVGQGGGTYLCAVAHTSGTFNTDFSDGKWLLLEGPITANSISIDTFISDGAELDYTLSNDPATGDNVEVYFDGVYQNRAGYTVTGQTLTLSAAPPNGVVIEVRSGVSAVIGTVLDGSISDAKIQAGAVTEPKIAVNAVTESKILNGAVSENKIANNSISNAKLQDNVLSADTNGRAKMANGYVNSDKVAAGLWNAIAPSGAVLQTITAEYTANSNLSTAIPIDDTVPEITEGTQILSASITPTSNTNKIRILFQGACSLNNNAGIAALFRNLTTAAIASSGGYSVNSTLNPATIVIDFIDSPATTSATTYSIRVGSSTVVRMNGSYLARFLGGSMRSTLVLQEIKA